MWSCRWIFVKTLLDHICSLQRDNVCCYLDSGSIWIPRATQEMSRVWWASLQTRVPVTKWGGWITFLREKTFIDSITENTSDDKSFISNRCLCLLFCGQNDMFDAGWTYHYIWEFYSNSEQFDKMDYQSPCKNKHLSKSCFITLALLLFPFHSVFFFDFRFAPFWAKNFAASCFQLNMLYFCVLYDNIEKKIWESLGKHVLPHFLIPFL